MVATDSISGSLEGRLLRLEALREIEALKARYTALADAKYTANHQRVPEEEWRRVAELQASCFTEDAIWQAGEFGGDIVGSTAIFQWFLKSPWRFALHYYVLPDIQVTGNHAEAKWRLWQIAIRQNGTHPVLLAAITNESYVKQNGSWLISKMKFEQIHISDLSESPVGLECLVPGPTKPIGKTS